MPRSSKRIMDQSVHYTKMNDRLLTIGNEKTYPNTRCDTGQSVRVSSQTSYNESHRDHDEVGALRASDSGGGLKEASPTMSRTESSIDTPNTICGTGPTAILKSTKDSTKIILRCLRDGINAYMA